MLNAPKGQYQYISKQKNRVILWTCVLFSIALALFFGGWIMTGTKRNLLTIVAVLGLLPASKSLVNVIMFCRAKGCSEALHEKLQVFDQQLAVLYDIYLTSYQVNFPISHMAIKGNVLIGITENAQMDLNACKKHLESMLTMSGMKNITLKIYDSESSYVERLEQLSESSVEENHKQQEIIDLLLSISL